MEERRILKSKIDVLFDEYEELDRSDYDIEKKNLYKIAHLLNDYEMHRLIERINNEDYIKDFKYSNLVDLHGKINQLSEALKEAKEEIDLETFYKNGEVLNFKKLRKKFKDGNLKARYPNFNFEAYEELFRNPVLEVSNFKGEIVKFDKFLVKKLLIAINQMIFSEMDFYITNVGKEGAGKSCFSSQLLLYLYFVLTKAGLIEYAYDIKKLFFSSVRSILEEQEAQKDGDYFRIMVLDEAYELNRQNFREESSREFKTDMRASRKMLRIVILNLPQIGELETAITLTRTNFIFYSDMDSDMETGTVKKGEVSMYIIPRGKFVYSPYQRRNVSDEEITNSLNRVMKDKNDAYKGFPKNTLIHKFKFAGVWGFDKDKYDKHIKSENKKRKLVGDIKMSDYVGYILYKKLPPLKHWGFDMKVKKDKRMYYTVQKFLKTKIDYRFIMNPDIRQKFDAIMEEER